MQLPGLGGNFGAGSSSTDAPSVGTTSGMATTNIHAYNIPLAIVHLIRAIRKHIGLIPLALSTGLLSVFLFVSI